jgi:chromosome segregation ATPase
MLSQRRQFFPATLAPSSHDDVTSPGQLPSTQTSPALTGTRPLPEESCFAEPSEAAELVEARRSAEAARDVALARCGKLETELAAALQQVKEIDAVRLDLVAEVEALTNEVVRADGTAQEQALEQSAVHAGAVEAVESADKARREAAAAMEMAEARVAEVEAQLAAAEARAATLEASKEEACGARAAAEAALVAAVGSSECDVKRAVAAALKEAQALNVAQVVEKEKEVEREREARRADSLESAAALTAARGRAADAEAIAAARVAEAEAATLQSRSAAGALEGRLCEAEGRFEAATVEVAAARTEVAELKGRLQEAEVRVADVESGWERGAKDASAREARLKKGLAEMKHKLEAALAEQARAGAAERDAAARLEALRGSAATAEARAALLERETERLDGEGRAYRSRAQALLASKDKELAGLRATGAETAPGVQELLVLVAELRAEAAAQAGAVAAAVAARDEAEAMAAKRAASAVADTEVVRDRLTAAERAAAEASQELQAVQARCTALEAQLQRRIAQADKSAAAPTVACSDEGAATLRAELQAALQELDAFRTMAARMAEQREEALAEALEHVAALRAQLEARERTLPHPHTPALTEDPVHPVSTWPNSGHLAPINTRTPDPNPDATLTLPRVSSFDMDTMMAPGATAARPQGAAAAAAMEQRLAVVEAENGELAADLARAQEQMGVLKEELREVERVRQRSSTSSDGQVCSARPLQSHSSSHPAYFCIICIVPCLP